MIDQPDDLFLMADARTDEARRRTMNALNTAATAQDTARATFGLMRDGLEGHEVSPSDVPNGNAAFQYAVGVTTEGGSRAIYRRRADERGTYGGWRWEAAAR